MTSVPSVPSVLSVTSAMPLPTFTSTVTFKTLLARDVYEFRVRKPAGFSFVPGQFILFQVPLVENPADIQTRAFSVASAPFEDDLLFVAKILPGGRASRWIIESLTEGSEVAFQGPFGNFVIDRGSEKDYLFIGTGTGVAPFRGMLLSALVPEAGDSLSLTRRATRHPLPQTPRAARSAGEGGTRRVDLIFGVKSEADVFWSDWLESISKKHPNVFIHTVLSQPSDSWTGHRGRVQTLAPLIVRNDFTRTSLYACGSPAMCKDVKAMALGEWGIDKKDVHVEGYI